MDWLMGKSRRKDKESPVSNPDESKLYLEDECVRQAIVQTDLENLITCPPGLCYNEWIASHTITLFEHTNLIYGAVSEFCTSTGCSTMSGPGNTQYLWHDEKGKKCKCAAPQYIDYVMTNTQKTILDESVFPTKYGNVFPSTFDEKVKKIHKYLFHVIAHIYHSHFREIVALNMHGHLNSLFKHFMLVNKHYNLVEEKETEILYDLFKKLQGSGPPSPSLKTADKNDNLGAGGDLSENQNSSVPNISEPNNAGESNRTQGKNEENKENENQDQTNHATTQQPLPAQTV